ncbi:MAG: carbon-nitrogen hydrolase family protein [Eubacteriales bacterium]|nr:carbon-nitrogen hydrolase family protein [Eubacteriales bacterium]
MKIAQIQSLVYDDKKKNLDQMAEAVEKAAADGADLVTFGEMFCCPYITELFAKYAEPDRGETWQFLSDTAKKNHVYLSPGTVPETDESGNIYNTAYVFDRDGQQIAKYRKMHMFDIQIKNGQYYRESDALTAGNEVVVFDTEFGKAGICICFDIRFPELARLMVLKGARFIIAPANFNMTSGPVHWQMLFRARAVDNQCFYIGTSCAFDPERKYKTWGHSLITDPWGRVLTEADEGPSEQMTEIDLTVDDKMRRQLPLLSARRSDIYDVIYKPDEK